ncbi:MAG: alpha-L-glutamate ligase, RimK family [Planctomycetota bacterium]|nr:alpha-L-glutamate ligase, RimK family [Planctomycetota bacterium]
MTHLAALVSGFGWHVQDLRRAADGLGIRFSPIPFSQLIGRVGAGRVAIEARGIPLTEVDGVLVRMMPPGSLEQVVFRMDALHRLAAQGVPVMNPPGAIEASVDKYLTLARIEADGLPVPATWVGESASGAMDAFESLGRDVVVKPLFGSEGRGLVRVTEFEVARRVFHALERVGAVLYVQQFIPHMGHDFRVFVLGNRVLGAIRRHAPAGDWRTNVAVGGRAEAIRSNPGMERLALRAAKAVGATMAGVDLLPGDDGHLVVLEVNAVPGWKALSAATGVDVASEILAELRGARR